MKLRKRVIVISELLMNNEIINKANADAILMLKELLGKDLVEIVLYGSCARGDYTEDSDIDIAVMTRCGRAEAKKYGDGLDRISTELAMKYLVVTNFVCLPYKEFLEKKSWYGYFYNIDKEGNILYG